MYLSRKLAVVIVAMASMSASQAALVWSIELNEPAGTGPNSTLLITGTLTNSSTSTENLGVIGGTAGVPPGFDFEVGGFASTPTGYLFDWAPAGAASFIEQFEGVDLAPGESFDFEFATLTPNAPLTPGATFTASLQLQLFDAPRPGPIIGSSNDSVSWTASAYSDFEVTFTFPGGSIFGYLPVPQVNGFDYYFTPTMLNTAVLGSGVTIESVEVSAFGQNNGDVVNFDWEVHIGPASFGLPEGQLTQTLVDPLTGYTRIAPTQFRFVIGNQVDDKSYQFSGRHDFVTGITTANPYFSLVQQAVTSPMNLTNGLYAQIFLWTADNRNSRIDFGQISLTVRGKMPAIQVEIDIKPGETPNNMKPAGKQNIPVAVLTTDTFDATQVDWETVRFGPDGAFESHGRAHVEDVDLDGDIDIVLHFHTQDTGIQCGDTVATLTGETFGGEFITGSDSIVTVKCD